MNSKTIKHAITAIFFTLFAVALADLYGTANDIFRISVPNFNLTLVEFWLAAIYSLATLKYRRKRLATVILAFIIYLGYSLYFTFFNYSRPLEIPNSNYFLEAKNHSYKVWERRALYDKMIGEKDTDVLIPFFPTKYAVIKYLQPKILKDDPQKLILEIKAGYDEKVTDTIIISR